MTWGLVPSLLANDPYDAALAAQVHPSTWDNPRPSGRYNLVVLGAGTAGLVCAAGAAGLGAKVALVERHLMGGDCLNVGCVPSKGVIGASRAFFSARSSHAFGVHGTEGLEIDFPAAMERMRRLRATISPHDAAQRFRDQLGVDVFFGQGRFTGQDSIEVAGQQLQFHRAAICTGARAMLPDIPGLAEAAPLTNETVFTLTSLPARLAVLGGGPIGCEMAQAFARFGSRVVLIQRGAQLLGREDADAAALLKTGFVSEGIDLRLQTAVVRVETAGAESILHLQRNGEDERVAVDTILVAVGRKPNLEGLELEAAGIKGDHAGVRVDDRLRTDNPRVFAAGDICSPYKFTHAADAQARILLANALFGGRQRVSRLVVPWCTYTDPEVAHVGLSEQEAKARGMDITTLTVPLTEVDRAVLDGEIDGFAKVHLRGGGDVILGATIVARHAGEMIGELSLAITNGVGLAAIGRTIHPYPTQAEVIKKLADAYNRRRLTRPIRALLGAWLQWQRR